MTAAIDAALSNIWTEEGLGILQKGADGAVFAALRRAYALGAQEATARLAQWENASNARRAALAAEQDQPEHPQPVGVSGISSGGSFDDPTPLKEGMEPGATRAPADPPAPPGLEEQLRAIWRDHHGQECTDDLDMEPYRRAATETPLARLGADTLQALRVKAGPFDDRPAEILAFLLHSAQVYGLMSEEEAKALAEPTEEP